MAGPGRYTRPRARRRVGSPPWRGRRGPGTSSPSTSTPTTSSSAIVESGDPGRGPDLHAGVEEPAEETPDQGPAPDMARGGRPRRWPARPTSRSRRPCRPRGRLVEGGLDPSLETLGQPQRPGPHRPTPGQGPGELTAVVGPVLEDLPLRWASGLRWRCATRPGVGQEGPDELEVDLATAGPGHVRQGVVDAVFFAGVCGGSLAAAVAGHPDHAPGHGRGAPDGRRPARGRVTSAPAPDAARAAANPAAPDPTTTTDRGCRARAQGTSPLWPGPVLVGSGRGIAGRGGLLRSGHGPASPLTHLHRCSSPAHRRASAPIWPGNWPARGHGVTLVARREGRLTDLAAELHQAHGVRAEVVGLDLTDADARGGLPGTLAERGLTVDVLVNNAGFSTTGPVHSSDRAPRDGDDPHRRRSRRRPLLHLRARDGGSADEGRC